MTVEASQIIGEPARRSPAPRRQRRLSIVILGGLCALAAFFLFYNLGHYALWDDEANTALIGEGTWRTGDTSAIVGNNIVAFRGGLELSHLKERYLPPLQYYVVAPFVGLWPGSSLAARLPFACFGLLSILLILWWIWRERAGPLAVLLTAMGLFGNVSLWLYLRQCRYYSLGIFFSLAISYLYLSAKRSRWTVSAIGLLSVGLLASNYLNYAALYAALVVDWLIFSRRRFPLNGLDALVLFAPQLLIGGFIVHTWYPLDKNVVGAGGIELSDKLRLFYWAWRDLNRCEFAALPLLLLAPVLGYWRHHAQRNSWLLRASLALVCYVLAVVALTPQKSSITDIFDVRYLAPIIPLLIAMEVMIILQLCGGRNYWLPLIVGTLAFGTNLFEGGGLSGNDVRNRPRPLLQSTVLLFAGELLEPPGDPYSLAAAWINKNVAPGQTVLVLPNYMLYPLMFHAPQAVYAWQLPNDPPRDLQGLNSAFYKGVLTPDYLICFGPDALRTVGRGFFPSPTRAIRMETINFFWRDLYRPELAWRTFGRIVDFDRQYEAIQIYRLLPSHAFP